MIMNYVIGLIVMGLIGAIAVSLLPQKKESLYSQRPCARESAIEEAKCHETDTRCFIWSNYKCIYGSLANSE